MKRRQCRESQGDGHEIRKAETGVMHRWAKNGQQMLEAREARKEPPLQVSEGAWPCWRLDFELPASRTARWYISLVSSHKACGPCYSSPRERIQKGIWTMTGESPERWQGYPRQARWPRNLDRWGLRQEGVLHRFQGIPGSRRLWAKVQECARWRMGTGRGRVSTPRGGGI